MASASAEWLRAALSVEADRAVVDEQLMARKYFARSRLLAPILVLVLTLAAIAAVWLLVQRSDSSRAEQLHVAAVTLALTDLQSAPFNAEPGAGGSPAASRAEIRADESSIARGLMDRAQSGVSLELMASGRSELSTIEHAVANIYEIALDKGGLSRQGARVAVLQKLLTVHSASLASLLAKMSRADAERANSARTQAKLGAAAAMLLLLVAFAFFYFRSVAAREAVERLAADKESLLGASRIEARTDALTHLGNRRALAGALSRGFDEAAGSQELLLAMFDLDGFKAYNDTFGHAAGDALLQRLGGRLASAIEHVGSAYRMGGDEFCMLARCSPDQAERLLDEAAAAMRDSGENWEIGCSHGAVWIPSEAATASDALKFADERMYANKASRSSAGRQVTDALLQVIAEQSTSLDEHVERVSKLSASVAVALGQSEHDVRQICLAAKLHDVGKTAIPSAILEKPGALDEWEWEFVCRHPLVGERIVLAAPALATTAPIIRSSHERVDGAGYPDGLAGEQIPIGARIISVCDAFDAMTSDRPYRPAMTVDAALAELDSNAGTQFDESVVLAFRETIVTSAGLEAM
jgi:diguanylate cyclase (GGDEF)-like protein